MGRTDDNANAPSAAADAADAADAAVDPRGAVVPSPSNVEIALVPSGYCVAHFTRAPVS